MYFLFLSRKLMLFQIYFCPELQRYSTSCQNNSVICNFLKRLCPYLISMLFLDQISFKTKQKSKYIVDFNYIFISIENILNFIEKIWDPIKTLKHTCYNVQLILLYSTMITVQHVYYEIHDEVRKNDRVHNSFINCLLVLNFERNYQKLNIRRLMQVSLCLLFYRGKKTIYSN